MQKFLVLLLFVSSLLPASAQTIWVTGAVEDSITHNPLPGVAICVAGDTAKTVTNNYGLFKIAIPPGSTHLQFRHPRYSAKTVPVENANRILVSLVPAAEQMDDIMLAKARSRAKFTQGANPNYGNVGMGIRTFYNETYGAIYENRFANTKVRASSTFAIDVDRAAYSNIRRFIHLKEKIPPDAVRIEEMVNYFHYSYPLPAPGNTLAYYSQYADCPWEPGHTLLQIAVRGSKPDMDSLPPCNLVFLIDRSGSMGTANKLPLLQAAFRILVNSLRAQDKVAIVAYAGTPGVILPCTSGSEKEKILNAIDILSASGTTAGEAAIKMAYQIAVENYIPNGNNRVIMATDGDFNVGQSSDKEMEELITEKKESGVMLTCLGFGMGNYKESKLESLSSKGNGNFAYIDNLEEANKIFAREFGSTLFTIAKDVQTQVWFNPDKVKAYRLIGYENKILKADTAEGERMVGGIVGAGHCAVALYEIIPQDPATGTDSLLAHMKISWRAPNEDTTVYVLPGEIPAHKTTFKEASNDFRFAASVALMGMILRKSEYKGTGDCNMVMQIARKALGEDSGGYRSEFLKMVKTLKGMKVDK
ncbi:YfbK domain-containing protein [Chitinophaga defluvii]|uniref:von Willebrand factor type A domain-containing protein n=1 Tax=Chitinophaga defluvii TaxID=3163343 RepID=A0ABV2TE14_9BACT